MSSDRRDTTSSEVHTANTSATPTGSGSHRGPLQPLPGRIIALVATGITVVTTVLVVVLWWAGTAGLSGAALVTARFDALRTGLSIGLGGGGIFALYLAWRRQHATEVGLVQKERDQADVGRAYELQREVAEHAREDAASRRVTDLYAKAVEQLGSDKAPVRLGGLYALERLAQDNEPQRQTVVNVLCAYLRMPYVMPGDPPEDHSDKAALAEYHEQVQEREVRLTAQRLLSVHLRPVHSKPEAFWPHIDLDLTGALLIEFDLAHCQPHHVLFTRAIFTGNARFERTTFSGDVSFESTSFTCGASFRQAKFEGRASFQKANFSAHASFYWTRFDRKSDFTTTRFHTTASFDETTFKSEVHFLEAKFDGRVTFCAARFLSYSEFKRATFHEEALFNHVTFTATGFIDAVFHGDTSFAEEGHHLVPETSFSYTTEPMRGATFGVDANFTGTTFSGGIRLEGALAAHPISHRTSWPIGWTTADEHKAVDHLDGEWHELVKLQLS